MSLLKRIAADQSAALKERETFKLGVLRQLSAALKNEQIAKQAELSEEDILAVIGRQVKQLEEAILDFQKGGREDLVEKNKQEIKVLSDYLPAQLSDSELKDKIERILENIPSEQKEKFGPLMGMVMKQLIGQADGARVRQVLQKILANNES